jgi:LPS-assembly protein
VKNENPFNLFGIYLPNIFMLQSTLKPMRNDPFWQKIICIARRHTAVPMRCHGILLSLAILVLTPGVVFGDDLSSQLSDDAAPWHIIADELSLIETESVYVAEGNVVVTKKDTRIAADYARFNQKSMVVTAKGHVVMSVGKDLLSADHLEINLKTEEGVIHNGSFFLEKNHFHIKGNEIKKTGKESFRADTASITSCDGEKPAWKITGRNLNVTIEGYGTAYHATFWVKNIPVLYTPFIAFPVKLKRQTGLLAPQLATSSRRGFEYIQPFFWAINDSFDATFYEHYMSLRGNKIGSEFRFMLSPQSKGTIMFDYLQDQEVDDGTGSSSEDWGYDDSESSGTSVDILRPNEDRYWFRMKQDQAMPAGFFASLDLDIVSDQDYLHEFKYGYTGFRNTRDYFNDEFGRDLDDYNDPIRLNRFNVDRRLVGYTLNAEVRWYDDVISRRQEDIDTTVQRLPSIQFDATKQTLLHTPFYFTFENEYTHFYREDALTEHQVTQDHRIDLYPRIYWPLRMKYFFTLEPSLGFRETYWQVEARDETSEGPENDDSSHREIYDGRLEFSTEFFKIFKTESQTIDRIKHTIKPQITYTYIPDQNQDEYPNFDSLDRIEAQDQVTYSLTNLLIYRSGKAQIDPTAPVPDGSAYNYRQFLRFYLEQTYDFIEAREEDPSEWENGKTQEPFSPIYAKLNITPVKYFSLDADAKWSTYDEDIISHNIAAGISDQRGDRLFIEHRFQKDDSDAGIEGLESLYSNVLLQITSRLSVTGEYERDLYNQRDLLASTGVLYKSQCWSLKLNYTREDDEQTYSFMVGLHGLGELESDL